MHSGYPIWDRYTKLESPGVPTLIKLGGAQGERTTICNYLCNFSNAIKRYMCNVKYNRKPST